MKEIEEAGGITLRKKGEIPTFGWDAKLKDVFGNIVCLYTPLRKQS